MPRDQRLYMTFPIDFLDHPKMAILSDNAIVTFVAMNGYSRVYNLDGRIPAETAKKKWKPKALTELQQNHPERPSVLLDGDEYVIHNYAEHQLTSTDIENLREKRAEAGSRGGKAKASAIALAKQTGSKPVAESESESRSESELLTDVTKDNESSHLPSKTGSGLDPISAVVQERAKRAGVKNLAAVADVFEATTGEPVSPLGAVLLAEAITSKAARNIRNVDAYLATTCRNSAAEVQQAYFDLDIGGVS